MLNFSKNVFEQFIARYPNCSINNVIITKQYFNGNGLKTIGVVPSANVQDIFVIDYKQYYQDISNIVVRGQLSTSNKINVGANNKITYNNQQGETNAIVLFVMKNTGLSCKTMFNDSSINLVSIDFIGKSITDIGIQGCQTSYFEYIDASNIYDKKHSILENTPLFDIQYVFFGNHNNIELNAWSFSEAKIKKIVFPSTTDGSTYGIPSYCFSDCTDLEEVVIPDCVTEIGAYAFIGCTNLKYVYIGTGVQEIGTKAFSGCTQIEKFVIDSGNNYICAPDGNSGCLLAKHMVNGVQKYKLIFADSVWWNIQFSDSYSVYVQNITDIMDNACIGDTTINDVDLSGGGSGERWLSLTTIHKNAFKDCTNLNNVKFPNAGNEVTIESSAFENCTSLTSVGDMWTAPNLNLGYKAFFGCTSLESINFGSISEIGDLAFGNTPNLQTINGPFNGTQPYFVPIGSNAIVTNENGYQTLVVGCQNTSIYTALPSPNSRIGDYAFYGCTNYVPSSQDMTYFDGVRDGNWQAIQSIGDYAFYGCVGFGGCQNLKLASLNIGEGAFYGCSFQSDFKIYPPYPQTQCVVNSKAFSNCTIVPDSDGSRIVNLAGITGLALDAFDGTRVDGFKNDQDNSVLWMTAPDRHAALLMKMTQGTQEALVARGGEGGIFFTHEYDYTASAYSSRDKFNILTIRTNAFTGANLNKYNVSPSQTVQTIHIPYTVVNIESNAFKDSLVNNSATGVSTQSVSLRFDPTVSTQSVQSPMIVNSHNSVHSVALLFCIGAKYFKKIVEDTYNNTTAPVYVASVGIDSTTNKPGISIDEVIHFIDRIPVMTIEYNSSNDIVIYIYYSVDPLYDSGDGIRHTVVIPEGVAITLMKNGQAFNQAEQQVYLDPEFLQNIQALSPGTSWTWCGIQIPNDLPTDVLTEYKPFTTLGPGAIRDCKWVDSVESGRRLNGDDMFAGCTKLKTIKAIDPDKNIFDGRIRKGMFNGCTQFTQILTQPYPIEFKEYAFKDTQINNSDLLTAGTYFDYESFKNTNYTSINLHSALYIDPTAFNGCNLISAKADSPCGYYFTGYGGDCIIDKNGTIVVGAKTFNINATSNSYTCNGIGEYAFINRNYPNFNVSNVDKDGFTIGESAFANSNVLSYVESGCTQTIINQNAFKNCTQLATVNVGSYARYGESSFENCTSIQSLVLRSATVEKNAFKGCTNMTSLRLEYQATDNCTIEPEAFIGCQFTTIDATQGYPDHTQLYIFNNAIFDVNEKKVIVGENSVYTHLSNFNVKIIGKHAYNGRGLVGDIVLPPSVTRIESYAFANNPELTNVHIPPTVEYIGSHAFDGCTGLQQVTLPDSCEFIGEFAFSLCPLTYGFNWNSVDKDYHQDSTIANQTIAAIKPNQSALDLTNCKAYSTIGESAFENTQVMVVKLPKTCTVIGSKAFKGCNLYELHVNSNSLTVQNEAFYGCITLRDIYFHKACTTTVGSNWCYGVGTNAPAGTKFIHIPQSMNVTDPFITALTTSNGFEIIKDIPE
jgi:hypothetical protein